MNRKTQSSQTGSTYFEFNEAFFPSLVHYGFSPSFREGDKKGFHTFPLPSFQYVVILEEGIGPKRVPKQTSHHIDP